MPGSPHFGPGQPMSERSTAQVIILFIVLPVIAGITLLSYTISSLLTLRESLTLSDWCWQLGMGGLLSFGLLTALPATGYQELRHRFKKKGQPPPTSGDDDS